MKTCILFLIFAVELTNAKGQTNNAAAVDSPKESPPAMFANIGDNWFSASELEQIAKDDAKQKKIDFDFTKARGSVWIHTGGSNIIAQVFFMSGFGKPAYQADIDRSGKVATNYVSIMVCGTTQTKK